MSCMLKQELVDQNVLSFCSSIILMHFETRVNTFKLNAGVFQTLTLVDKMNSCAKISFCYFQSQSVLKLRVVYSNLFRHYGFR